MKTILALALAGSLSMTSLAEAENSNPEAQETEFGSDAYILNLFHYAQSAKLTLFQKNPLPTAARAKPCSAEVYPASPSQATKAYYLDSVISFDEDKIHSGDNNMPAKLPVQNRDGIATHENYCRTVNINNPNLNKATGTKYCVMPKVGRYVLMSDIFKDTCDKYFRGFWETAGILEMYKHGDPKYTSMGEHSITSSIGRYDGMEKNSAYSGAFDFIPGPTGAINVTRFRFFVPATEEDMKATRTVIERELAPKGKYFLCKDRTFNLDEKSCEQKF
jgi:hypothetical protein